MAENNPASADWPGLNTIRPGQLWAGVINIERLTDAVNKALDEAIAVESANVAFQRAKADRYRRQRNGLIVILTGIALNSYLNARNKHEAERVNPPKEML